MEAIDSTPEKNSEAKSEQPESSDKSELTSSLEQIDGKITERYITGKFKAPVILHGQQILGKVPHPGYITIPEIRFEEIDPTGQFLALNDIVRTGVDSPGRARELQNTLDNSHVVGYLVDNNKPGESTIDIIYPYEFYDSAGRPALTAEVFLKLPTESLKQLLSIITEKPDALEEFYQITTAGLDPSVKRYKSSQLAIVDLDTFMPIDKFPLGNMTPRSLPQVVNAYSSRLNPQGLTILQYSSPHGSIDKAEAEATRQEAARQKQEAEQARQSLQAPKAETTQPQKIPKPLDNPSGLNPDAPLTKLINAGIRLFRPKPK